MAEENWNDYNEDESERIEDAAYAPREFPYDQPGDNSAYLLDEEYFENLLQQIDEALNPPTLAPPEISELLVWQVQEEAQYSTEQQSDDPTPLEPDEAIGLETQEALDPSTLAPPEISELLVWQVQEEAQYSTEQQSDDPTPLEPDETISPETQEELGQVPRPWLADDGTFDFEEAANDDYADPDDYLGI
jgi:hypothetical protein